jgi:hypothetical protein
MDSIKYIGMDVHKETISIAVLDSGGVRAVATPLSGAGPEPEYPATMLVRSVRHQGQIRWKKHEVFLSEVLWGERVGLLPTDERWFTIYFSRFPIARFDSRKLRVLPFPEEKGFCIADAGEGDDLECTLRLDLPKTLL